VASLAESRAVFEMQKTYIENRVHHVNRQIEKIDRVAISDVRQKIGQIEETCRDLQNKLESLKGDADWVKFE
jgi:peptidoglycan hydrolase CwlO-like protein